MRALHVFKRAYADPKNRYLGSVKDIRSRTEYFAERRHESHELLLKWRNQYSCELTGFSQGFWSDFDVILVETTHPFGALRFIRKMAPDAVILIRSHNAELLHRYHWARAGRFHRLSVGFLIQALERCLLDCFSSRASDWILSIDNWETQNYWSKVRPHKKAVWVPFFLPETYLAELMPEHRKRNICVHFGASLENPLITDATLNFIRLVDRVAPRLPDWRFVATGACASKNHCEAKFIQWTGLLEKPYDALNSAKAMALLSPYGFGFKTKILEAVMAKAFVILPHALYRRLPEQLVKFCIPIDHRSESEFENALRRCEGTFPEGNPNAELRQIAFEQMDAILMERGMRCSRRTESGEVALLPLP